MSTAFAHTVEASFATPTPTAKRIAGYMLANVGRLGLETANHIAQQMRTSGISVGRFSRNVGYRNLGGPNRELRGAQTRPRVITDRLDARHNRYCEAAARREIAVHARHRSLLPVARDFACYLRQVKKLMWVSSEIRLRRSLACSTC